MNIVKPSTYLNKNILALMFVFAMLVSTSVSSMPTHILPVTNPDTLVMKNGEILEVKILKFSEFQVSYKLYDDLDGVTYKSETNEISSIRYANGAEISINSGPVDLTIEDNVEPSNKKSKKIK